MFKVTVFGGLCLASLCARSADLGQYQLILDKNLFGGGGETETTTPVAPPPVAPPSWSNDYRMTMMTFDQRKQLVRIGLQNLRDESALLLIEGEPHPDFQLVSADFDRGLATVRHRGSTHRFSLESGPSQSPRLTAPETPESRTVRPPARRVISNRPSPQPTPIQPVRFQSSEELQEHLKQVQMDALRSGKPPLPIPLTREMDDQLVKEGVLPPQGSE